MNKIEIMRYQGKTVRVLLKNTNVYTLNIDKVEDTSFRGIDKYGKEISITNDSLSVIELL